MGAIYQAHRSIVMAKDRADAASRAKAIVEALGGAWHGTRGECRCPAHDDRSPSLSVRLGETAILFHCFAGCDTVDVLKALRRIKLHDHRPLQMPKARPRRDLAAIAVRIWRESVPLPGTLAEDYLKARGLSGPFSRVLRFNPATILGSGPNKRTMPALIAAVESDLGIVAIQRTFLDPMDVLRRPVPKPKVALGLMGGAAIRLAPATEELGLAEGIEDAQSAMEWFGTPTWALAGVQRLPLVIIPQSVRRIIVYGDRGRVAARLLEKARDHLTANGRELISRVPEKHKDWNDAWRAHKSR